MNESPTYCRCPLPHTKAAVKDTLTTMMESSLRGLVERGASATERRFLADQQVWFIRKHEDSGFTPEWFERTLGGRFDA